MLEWAGGSIHHHNELDWSEHPQKDARSPKTSVLLTDGSWNTDVRQHWDLTACVKLSWVILKRQLSLSLSLSLPLSRLRSFSVFFLYPSRTDAREHSFTGCIKPNSKNLPSVFLTLRFDLLITKRLFAKLITSDFKSFNRINPARKTVILLKTLCWLFLWWLIEVCKGFLKWKLFLINHKSSLLLKMFVFDSNGSVEMLMWDHDQLCDCTLITVSKWTYVRRIWCDTHPTFHCWIQMSLDPFRRF